MGGYEDLLCPLSASIYRRSKCLYGKDKQEILIIRATESGCLIIIIFNYILFLKTLIHFFNVQNVFINIIFGYPSHLYNEAKIIANKTLPISMSLQLRHSV